MNSQKRYRTFKDLLKETFPNQRVYKIPVDAGFTCPNIDGTKAYGGCIYCDNRSFSPAAREPQKIPLRDQIERGVEFYRLRYKAQKFILYFQAYTNTYGHVDVLKSIYDQVLNYPDIVGFSVGTRPDCVPDETLQLLHSYTRKLWVSVEYGLQSKYDRTLQLTNRAHTYADFTDAVRRSQNLGFHLCIHLIFGLPGESLEDMRETVRDVAQLPLDSVKLHHLYVSPHTALEKLYRKGLYTPLTFPDYLTIICDAIERLPPTLSIQRLMGELDGPYVMAPLWGLTKSQILLAIDRELERRNTSQGRKWGGTTRGCTSSNSCHSRGGGNPGFIKYLKI